MAGYGFGMRIGVDASSRSGSRVRARTRPPVRGNANPGLRILDAGKEPGAPLLARLRQIAAMPCVTEVLALPDLHQKPHMEVPSSLAITTSDAIVPEFTSVAVNDGMGVVVTDLDARELSPGRIVRLLTGLNRHASSNAFEENRYSLSAADLPAMLLEGGRAAARRYDLSADALDCFEWGGCVPVPSAGEEWREAVPPVLLRSPAARSEMGLNFGGNHFLELQVVDEVLDRATAAAWGLAPGRVVIMYHLGPGPFGGTLLHHYSRREKLAALRVPLLFLSKLHFHFLRRRGQGTALGKWNLHFRRNGWTAYPAGSEEGLLLRQAIAMATNFGFAYRTATVAAIRDVVRETLSPTVGTRLLCDVSHNGIYEERWGDGTAWVARHNACRLDRGGPSIVAGAHDVASFLGLGRPDAPEELHSYDHGAGHLIETWRRDHPLTVTGTTTTRLRMTRGPRGRVVARDLLPVGSPEPIDGLMGCLARHRVMDPVVRLRPVGTLKN